MTTEQRLAEQLDAKDAEIEELSSRLEEAETRAEGARAWSLPREIADDHPTLPVPRLEMAWTPDTDVGWREHVVEYRLVYRHLDDRLIAIILGRTKVGCSGGDPFSHGPLHAMPFRDGAHSAHDAAHLSLPLIVVAPDGPVLMNPPVDYPRQYLMGVEHRKVAP